MLRYLFLLLIIGATFSISAAAQSSEQIVQQAKKLLASKSYKQAYSLLQKEESKYGGQAKFDYYLGMAALQAGKPAEAVFALERALDAKPDMQQARAELGRAYYYLGENIAAQEEFLKIKSDSKIPNEVKSNVDKFLAAIDSRFDSSARRLELYIEGGLGYDSNVNSATDDDLVSFFLPIPGIDAEFTTTLDESNRETASTFLRVKPGIRYSQPIKDDLNFFASGDIAVLDISDADQFSSQTLNVSSGIAKLAGSNQYHGVASFQQYKIDGNNYRDLFAISGQWLKTINPKNTIISYVQINNISYENIPIESTPDPDDTNNGSLRDGGINSVGVNWLQGSARSVNTYGLYYGQEKIDNELQQFQAKNFIGLRAGTKISWRGNSIFANGVYQINSFKQEDPLQRVKRDSKFLSIDVGIDIPLLRKLTITPRINLTQNSTDNNLGLFDYERTLFDVNAVYTF